MDSNLWVVFGMVAVLVGGGLWVASRPAIKDKKDWEDGDGM